MKSKYIFLIVFLAANAVIWSSYFSQTDHARNFIQTTSTLFSACTSLTTLLITIALFSRFGVEKVIASKQLDSISDLLKTLRTINFFLSCESLSIRLHPFLWRNDMDEDLARFSNLKVAITDNLVHTLGTLENHRVDIYLPPSIAERLDAFRISTISSSKGFDKEDKSVLKAEGKVLGDLINNHSLTFGFIVSSFHELLTEIENWIEKQTEAGIALNVRF